MGKINVVFFVSTDYDNLGVGYMVSVLTEAGFESNIIDSRRKKPLILKTIKALDPIFVGFSITFLNHFDQFVDLIEYLRKEGINCHFTAGGHYASLKYNELFDTIPELDSIVSFEGEYTILELVKSLNAGSDWRKIIGIIYKDTDKILKNPLRPLEADLDKFPYPYRPPLREYAFKKKFTSILAGRGCRNNCTFCNTREFYERASGPIKRIRKPEMVVREMEYLFTKKKCSVFIFHDDDFPLKTSMEIQWLEKFYDEIKHKNLDRKILWKINCRPDEVEEERFTLMKQNGLFLVFLGIEDGTNVGLKNLNKNLTVEENLRSISVLKKLEIEFDYGFMLFQTETTFRSLNENLRFLRQFCSDGYTPITFLKLLPLYETRIEKELLKSGRLKVRDGKQDYDFLEESMNHYYDFIMDCFVDWMGDPGGVENISKWARSYFSVYMHYYDQDPDVLKYLSKLRRVISKSNIFFLDTMTELALIFESGQYKEDKLRLKYYMDKIKSHHEFFREEIIDIMTLLLSYAENHKARAIF